MLAEQESIFVHETGLHGTDGYYQRTKSDATILLEHNLSETEKRCILIHEIMHHKYTPDGFTAALFDKFCYAKHEKFVDLKAAEKLMPLEELKKFLKNSPEATIYELADFFSVTERMAHIRIEFLANEGLL